MNDPVRWSQEPLGRPTAELLLRGTRRPRPPGADDLSRLGAVVAQIPRRSALVTRRWSRFGTAATAAIVVASLGTTVWALRGRRSERAGPPTMTLAGLEPAKHSISADIAASVKVAAPEAPLLEVAPPRAPVRRGSVSGGKQMGGDRRPHAVATAAIAGSETQVDGLNREIALIDAARADVKVAPARALDALDRHRRGFPQGQLAAEREFLAIEALCHLNRSGEARRRAEALRIDYPSSSYATRAARLLPPAP
jgi:hypothetical protein